MALEQGAKETRQQDIIDLLQKRFGELPESLTKAITQVDWTLDKRENLLA